MTTTIGQRIAALRKEHAYSQEELGVRLGVSRQAIYKWESDASLPEVEKLIALSRLFGVSVGYLLCTEDSPRQSAAGDASQTDTPLTEQQLNMVEEIASRYIAAQDARQKKVRRKWPFAAAILAFIAVLAMLGDLNRRLDQQYNGLQNRITSVEESVGSRIDGVSGRVESILKSQNDLTASYSTALLSTDPAAGTATFSLRAVPKTYVEGMEAVFYATQQSTGETTEAAGIPGPNQEFSAQLTCPLTDETVLGVVFRSGNTKETQSLEIYYDLYRESLPAVDIVSDNLMFLSPQKDGTYALDRRYVIVDEMPKSLPLYPENPPAEIVSLRAGLFLNRELVAWCTPCQQPPDNYTGYDDSDFYRLPDVTLSLQEDDRLCEAVLLTDEYGREMIYTTAFYKISPEHDGGLVVSEEETGFFDPTGWSFS